MSRDDDFSISELRRKREASQNEAAASQANPQPPQHTPIQTTPVVHQLPARPIAPAIARGGDDDEEESEFSVDTGRMLAALKRQWYWLVVGAIVCGALGGAWGYHKGKYAASMTMWRLEVGSGSPLYSPEKMSPASLKSVMQSAELMRRVATKVEMPVDRLMMALNISDDKQTELITVTGQSQNAATLPDLVNRYADEAIVFTKELQIGPVTNDLKFLKGQIGARDVEIRKVNNDLVAFMQENNITDPKVETDAYSKELGEMAAQIKIKGMDLKLIDPQIADLQNDIASQNPLTEQLDAARARRSSLLATLTPLHPTVQAVEAEIKSLEERIATAGPNDPNTKFPAGSYGASVQKQIADLNDRKRMLTVQVETLTNARDEILKASRGLGAKGSEYAAIKSELTTLTEDRQRLADIQRIEQQYMDGAKGYVRVNSYATKDDVETLPRRKKAISFGTKGVAAGLVIAAALLLLVELKDRTMKTAAEVEKVTGLRVLASLGDLDKMTTAERDNWAFRAWTIMAGQLNASPNHGMVCGFVSSGHGEGRSTWIRLLGNAASQRGLRVLTVATKPSGTDEPASEAQTQANEQSFTQAVDHALTEVEAEAKAKAEAEAESLEVLPAEDGADQILTETLSPNSLAFPAEVTKKFIAGEMPSAHIPLPGWVWNLERRRQWQMALGHWRGIDNLVLLVELPPASVPESVLLAESLPQLVWLTDSGKASISDTKEQLEMMRHAKCRIVGAVLNHEPDPIIKL